MELVDRLHIQDESSIRYFCKIYKTYYNEIRPHQDLLGDVSSDNYSTQTKVDANFRESTLLIRDNYDTNNKDLTISFSRSFV
ncbi:MAG: hypothetical protein ACI9QD_000035 [Thermoproteota archaeon]|jgi:hypothetical protein